MNVINVFNVMNVINVMFVINVCTHEENVSVSNSECFSSFVVRWNGKAPPTRAAKAKLWACGCLGLLCGLFTLAITPESKSVLMYSMREAQRFIRERRQPTLCSSFLEGDGGVEGLFCVFLEAEKLLVWQRWCLYTFLRPHIGWA